MREKWSDIEVNILKKEYPIGGYKGVKNIINRTHRAIQFKAQQLKLYIDDETLKNLRSEYAKNNCKKRGWNGENNPNWKGGISKYSYKYKKHQYDVNHEKMLCRMKLKRKVDKEEIIKNPCFVFGI